MNILHVCSEGLPMSDIKSNCHFMSCSQAGLPSLKVPWETVIHKWSKCLHLWCYKNVLVIFIIFFPLSSQPNKC